LIAADRTWPGTQRVIEDVEAILLRAVERRAAQDAAVDLLASAPDSLFEEEQCASS
jgi:hypothetical protein